MSSEQELLDQILFLERCIQLKERPENIKFYGKSESPKVRQLAAFLNISLNGNCIDIVSFDDPSSLVRSTALLYCKDLDILSIYLKDTNSIVRISVLKSLNKMVLTREEQNKMILNLLPLINDKELSVRILFSKLLSKFYLISSEIIVKMFDKEDFGTFIFGAEDENVEVRIQMVKSMKKLIKVETADCAFEFLTDLLNDDSLSVRIYCIKLLYCITKKHKITKNFQSLFGLTLCSRERNENILKYLIKTLSNLKYLDMDIIPHIIRTFDLKDSFFLLKKIIKGNEQLFRDRLKENKFLFSNQEQQDNKSKEYLCDILILKTLEDSTIETESLDKSYQEALTSIESKKPIRKEFKMQIRNLFKSKHLNTIINSFSSDHHLNNDSGYKENPLSLDNSTSIHFSDNISYSNSLKIVKYSDNETSNSNTIAYEGNYTNRIIKYLNEELNKIECSSEIEKILKFSLILIIKNPRKIILFLYRFGFSIKRLERLVKKYQNYQYDYCSLFKILKKVLKKLLINRNLSVFNYKVSLDSCFYNSKDQLSEFRFEIELNDHLKGVCLVLEQNDEQLIFPIANSLKEPSNPLKQDSSILKNDKIINFSIFLSLKCIPSGIKYYLGAKSHNWLTKISEISEISNSY